MGQDNAIYKFSLKLSFSSKGQNKSKLQKQISNNYTYLNRNGCFCSFDLFCLLVEKDNFSKSLYIALSCPIK